MAELESCIGVIQPGQRCVLGHLAGGGYAVWLVGGGPPAATFENAAWLSAVAQFESWEPSAPRGRSGGLLALWITLAVVALFVVIGYSVLHAHKYESCPFSKPSYFSWPSSCAL